MKKIMMAFLFISGGHGSAGWKVKSAILMSNQSWTFILKDGNLSICGDRTNGECR